MQNTLTLSNDEVQKELSRETNMLFELKSQETKG